MQRKQRFNNVALENKIIELTQQLARPDLGDKKQEELQKLHAKLLEIKVGIDNAASDKERTKWAQMRRYWLNDEVRERKNSQAKVNQKKYRELKKRGRKLAAQPVDSVVADSAQDHPVSTQSPLKSRKVEIDAGVDEGVNQDNFPVIANLVEPMECEEDILQAEIEKINGLHSSGHQNSFWNERRSSAPDDSLAYDFISSPKL